MQPVASSAVAAEYGDPEHRASALGCPGLRTLPREVVGLCADSMGCKEAELWKEVAVNVRRAASARGL